MYHFHAFVYFCAWTAQEDNSQRLAKWGMLYHQAWNTTIAMLRRSSHRASACCYAALLLPRVGRARLLAPLLLRRRLPKGRWMGQHLLGMVDI